ncbi:MAG: type II toxin-antitoxin system VapC family toxin [Nanoarchaeota archaeon]|nr:type II toxin-antitoxin system VapC family toxin [Nanoarchaeota archaeon]
MTIQKLKKNLKELKKQKHFIDSCVWIELYLQEGKWEKVHDYIGELKNKKYKPHVNLIIIGEVIKTIKLKSKKQLEDINDFLSLLDLLGVKIIDITHISIYKGYNDFYDNLHVSKKDSMDILNLSSAYNNTLNFFVTIEDKEKPIWKDNYLRNLIKIKTL